MSGARPARATGAGIVIAVYSERRRRVSTELATGLAAALSRELGPDRVAVAADELPVTNAYAVAIRDLSATATALLPDTVRAARARCDVTIIAPEEGRSERAFVTLEHADLVLLLSDLTVTGIRSTQGVLRLLASLGFPFEKVQVVVYGEPRTPQHPLAAADAALALKRDVFFHLPVGVSGTDAYDGMARKVLKLVASSRH